VEQNAESIRAAKQGATALGVSVDFFSASAADFLQDLVKKGETFDLILVDPPRAGAKDCLESLRALGASTLLMVSCDPVTLSRDLRRLVDEGYEIEALSVFDMFPQTHHFETLAVLRLQAEPFSPGDRAGDSFFEYSTRHSRSCV
jgi:23S rRNA (uracil1939-C5)-methyltransferase